MRHSRLVAVASFVAVAAVTLGLKVGAHGVVFEHDQAIAAEQQAGRFLAAHGWLERKGFAPASDDGIRAAHYVNPACPAGLLISVAPASADSFFLLGDMARSGDRIFYVYGGGASASPPSSLALLREKLQQLFSVVSRLSAGTAGILVVSAPPSCQVDTTLPWRDW